MALDIRLAAAICICSIFASAYGSYVILIPKQWQLGGLTQVCVVVDDPSAPAGEIILASNVTWETRRRLKGPPPNLSPASSSSSSSSSSLSGQQTRSRQKNYYYETVEHSHVYLPLTSVYIPAGEVEFCEEIALRESEEVRRQAVMSITGNVAGSTVNLTANVRYYVSDHRTIIQTDKYLYQPGQVVRFRILTHYGPLMNISTEAYPEVWVTTPSYTRIAQWLNVDNSAGLVHLEMQLADEPEKGSYQIQVRSEKKGIGSASFKVEEYVLPRFEVTIEPPKYVLATYSSFTFKVCAKYTFGQPVKGNLLVKIDNNGNKKCRIAIIKNETISGCKEIMIFSSDMRMIDCHVNSISIKAEVSEEGTGVQLDGTHSISISRRAVKFKTLYNDKYMKFGLPYTVKVRAELPDGSPAGDVLVEMCYDGSCKNISTPTDGVITAYVNKFDSRRVLMKNLVSRVDMYDSTFTTDIERYYSPSNSSLMIHAPEGDIKCVPGEVTQHTLQVLFSTPDMSSAKISVQVVARDRIQYWASEEYQLTPSELPFQQDYERDQNPSGTSSVGIINIPLKLAHTVSPSAWVLVWYIRDDGEVVSDSAELKMEKCLPNSVNFLWSTNEAQPGEQATLSLISEPNSICSIGVVDKSVELLSSSNALTVDSFFNGISGYFNSWRYRSQINDYRYCEDKHPSQPGRYSYYTDYVDALKMFDDSGLFAFSDLQLETRPCEKQEYSSYVRGVPISYSGSGGGGNRMHDSVVASSNRVMSNSPTMVESAFEEVSSNPRTDFPETWLWDLVVIPPYGEANQEVTLPDTITEWVGNAVCVHPLKGVGVSERTTITTFTPFFLDLTLPPSVKRGEILPLKISIFNYMEESLPVTVILEESLEYEVMETATARKSLCLESQDMNVHTVRIRPTVIGDVNITVSAFVDYHHTGSCGSGQEQVQKSDSMIRSLLVESDGFPREKTWTKYICSEELSNGEDSLESWEVSAPSAIVEGSDRGWVMVVGDLLALSVQNLGHLIRMPYGCGEQNMVNFAPNIFILRYLEATNQNAPEAKTKLLNFMNTGYQRQLLYLRRDGSFSAFGNADDSGSTWLTAFVVKSLAQAQAYILIDQDKLVRSIDWLQRQQDSKGCYIVNGALFNKALRGGVDTSGSSAPLTAYVMISLLESGLQATDPSVINATQCLRSHSTQNMYVMALKAYAFALARHPDTPQLIQILLDLATETRSSLHWDLPHSSWRSRSLEVETAGYAILAMLTWNPETYDYQARKIVKWISLARNGQGGFISTQDTVVALQAMAVYESNLNQGVLDVVATVKTADLSHSFKVEESNKLVQQQVSIPSLPATVSLGMTGEGCTLMQAVLRYNIPEPEPSDAFSVNVNTQTVRDKNCVTKQVTACASYLLDDAKSNMAVIEVNLISGYIPEKSDLKNLVKENSKVIKRYEINGSKLSFYIQEFTAEEVCVNFRVLREVTVENVKPGSVVVYDYYQPEFSISKSFTLPPPEDCLKAW